MYRTYKDRAAFLMVYIHEAHPSDGWQTPSNVKDKVVFAQPKSFVERRSVATQCCQRMNVTMPCVVDGMDNAVDQAYAAWPERIFVIHTDGKIAYAGRQGPFGFDPREAEQWLRKNLRK